MALQAERAQAGHASVESIRIYLQVADDWLAFQCRRAAEAIDAQLLRRRRARLDGEQGGGTAAYGRPGRVYYLRKIDEGETPAEARRAIVDDLDGCGSLVRSIPMITRHAVLLDPTELHRARRATLLRAGQTHLEPLRATVVGEAHAMRESHQPAVGSPK